MYYFHLFLIYFSNLGLILGLNNLFKEKWLIFLLMNSFILVQIYAISLIYPIDIQ